jgi:hypothetical protein
VAYIIRREVNMARALGNFTIVLFPLFALAIILIRTQSSDNAGLRVFLLPPKGCPAPCWQGIRPGVTTMARAAILLEQAGSLDYDIFPGAIQGEGFINWRTADRSISGSIRFIRGIAVNIEINTGISLLDIWSLLGDPDSGQYLERNVYQSREAVGALPFVHSIYYTGYGISGVAVSECMDFWQQVAHVVISADEHPATMAGGLPLASYRRTACAQTLNARGTVRADG